MNIQSIKNRANLLLQTCKPQYIRILIIIMLINCVASLITDGLGLPYFASLIMTLLFLTVSHGYVVSSLKIVRNTSHTLSDDDAWVGLKRFKELFPTYILVWFFQFIITAIFMILSVIVLSMLFGGFLLSTESIAQAALGNANVSSFMALMPRLYIFICIVLIAITVIMYLVSLYFFAVPYLLERYHMENGKVIKESCAFIKGHKRELFRLDISFLGWIILQIVISFLLSEFLSFIPFIGYGISLVVSGFIAIYTYQPQQQLSHAIFFEEIAYKRYGGTTQTEQFKQEEFVEEPYINETEESIDDSSHIEGE